MEAVDLSEWIASESEGIDTKVGEMGERISGGQRQRLALARALLRETPIMILDEATSQVDRETEARVLAGIRRRTSDKTLIVVAHRLDTIRDVDHIIVMDSGRIVEVEPGMNFTNRVVPYALWRTAKRGTLNFSQIPAFREEMTP